MFFLQEDERVISFERGKQLADSLGLEFFETSAKENINVRVSHRHLRNIGCLMVHTACLVCFISTVNGRSKKRKKRSLL
jgi:hypothetical protein